MVLGKVLARGQVTLPSSVRREAGIETQDVVSFEVVGPGLIEIRRLPRLSLAEVLKRYPIEGDVDEQVARAAWEAAAAADVLGTEDR